MTVPAKPGVKRPRAHVPGKGNRLLVACTLAVAVLTVSALFVFQYRTRRTILVGYEQQQQQRSGTRKPRRRGHRSSRDSSSGDSPPSAKSTTGDNRDTAKERAAQEREVQKQREKEERAQKVQADLAAREAEKQRKADARAAEKNAAVRTDGRYVPDAARKVLRLNDIPVDATVPLLPTQMQPDVRPPLASLIRDTQFNIVGDVRWLLDFAILGHAKCATSFLMSWLGQHPQLQIWEHEVCELYDNRPAELARKLYEELPVGDYLRGFKCPGHFSRRALRFFRRYYSNTHLIVGLRHPVRWFESYYNFRIRHHRGNGTMPHPDRLIGPCIPEAQGVCTDRANFHANLAIFGKTNMTNPAERVLLRLRDKYQYISPIDNPVFLYDVAQLYDDNITRVAILKKDLQHFVGLTTPLPDEAENKASHKKLTAIDICEPQFAKLRAELVLVGKRASLWIRKFFVEAPNVYVSSRDHFEDILKEWKTDPCAPTAESSRLDVGKDAGD